MPNGIDPLLSLLPSPRQHSNHSSSFGCSLVVLGSYNTGKIYCKVDMHSASNGSIEVVPSQNWKDTVINRTDKILGSETNDLILIVFTLLIPSFCSNLSFVKNELDSGISRTDPIISFCYNLDKRYWEVEERLCAIGHGLESAPLPLLSENDLLLQMLEKGSATRSVVFCSWNSEKARYLISWRQQNILVDSGIFHWS